jgi:hypothetical protein
MKKEEIFWNWFKEHEKEYHFYSRLPDSPQKTALNEALQDKVHEYCEKLYIEIIFDGYDLEKEYFVVSALCNKNYFKQAAELNKYAPHELSHWTFRAFVPPAKQFTESYAFDYGDIELKPEIMWFRQMVNSQNPWLFGLTVFFKKYNTYKNDPHLPKAVQELLSMELGEESFALDLHYLDIAQLPFDPKKKGLSKLSELSKHIDRHKKKYLTYSDN